MQTLNTQRKNKDLFDAIELDFALVLSAGFAPSQQLQEVQRILQLYKQKGYIDKFESVVSSPAEISATIYCPLKKHIVVKVP